MATRADLRSVRMIVNATETREGAGFPVRRPFPGRVLDHLDPFLLLDEMGPQETRPGEAKGAPDHPHRGFETVTYLLAGEMEHRDSQGNVGRIGPGDVQWMTAGDGVVHSEMPSPRILAEGGPMHGFQLWVNLPRAAKRTRPRYQDLRAADLPAAATPDGRARVRLVAGAALGAEARARTHTPILYLHASLDPGGTLELPVPSHWNAFAYPFRGRVRIGREGRLTGVGQMVVLEGDGGAIALAADPETGPGEVLVLAGEPIGEPVVRYGPFVMNTEEELREAFADYRAGRMGSIRPELGARP